MNTPTPSELQQAIDFLSSAEELHVDAALPDVPDYPALARHAQCHGRNVTPLAIRCAFQLIMRTRLLGPAMQPDSLFQERPANSDKHVARSRGGNPSV